MFMTTAMTPAKIVEMVFAERRRSGGDYRNARSPHAVSAGTRHQRQE